MFLIVYLREFSSLLEMNLKLLEGSKVTAEEAFYSVKEVQVCLQEMLSDTEFVKV